MREARCSAPRVGRSAVFFVPVAWARGPALVDEFVFRRVDEQDVYGVRSSLHIVLHCRSRCGRVLSCALPANGCLPARA